MTAVTDLEGGFVKSSQGPGVYRVSRGADCEIQGIVGPGDPRAPSSQSGALQFHRAFNFAVDWRS